MPDLIKFGPYLHLHPDIQFPSEMIDDMIKPYLAGASQQEQWLVHTLDGEVVAVRRRCSRGHARLVMSWD